MNVLTSKNKLTLQAQCFMPLKIKLITISIEWQAIFECLF